MYKIILIIGLCLVSITGFSIKQVESTEMVHQFVNPSFGGNPFNGPNLLNSALAQNAFEETSSGSSFTRASALESFEERLNRAVLNRLSTQIINSIFGEGGGLQEGTFDTGNFTIVIVEGLEGITISITDQLTGDSTTVEVPFL